MPDAKGCGAGPQCCGGGTDGPILRSGGAGPTLRGHGRRIGDPCGNRPERPGPSCKRELHELRARRLCSVRRRRLEPVEQPRVPPPSLGSLPPPSGGFTQAPGSRLRSPIGGGTFRPPTPVQGNRRWAPIDRWTARYNVALAERGIRRGLPAIDRGRGRRFRPPCNRTSAQQRNLRWNSRGPGPPPRCSSLGLR